VPPDILGDKRAYRRSGIQEYLVWQVFDQKIDWFSLQDGDLYFFVTQPRRSDLLLIWVCG